VNTTKSPHVPSSGSSLVEISRRLGSAVDVLHFADPVTHVYNPLTYAREPHEAYLRSFGHLPDRVILLGMNPGPFGMVQTGVPFGDVAMVRDWMGVTGRVDRPRVEHPKRPIEGFSCARSEVSGARLYGWAKERFQTAQRFFEQFFVLNYCPLAFLEDSGRNRTPDKLPATERAALFSLCDQALIEAVGVLQPRMVLGVGHFAHGRVIKVFGPHPAFVVGTILHPSPASPAANRGWANLVEQELRALGLSLRGV